MPEQQLDMRKALAWLGLAFLFVLTLGLLWFAGRILLLVFAGVLVAVVLRAAIGVVQRRTGMPDKLAYAVVIVAIVALLVGFGWIVGPNLLVQAGEFRERIPGFIENVRGFLEDRPWGSWLVEQFQGMAAGSGGGEGGTQDGGGGGGGSVASQLGGAATRITTTISTTLAHMALVAVLGLFLAVNPPLYRRGIIRLFPGSAQQRATEVIDELGETLKHWLVGQLALMFITGLLTGIGLVILGIPLALGLAFFVGLMEFIPFIGPIIGYIPILMVSATQGGTTLIWALVLYLAIQQIEGNIATPLIQQRAVSLPPALTISAVFLGGALFGMPGAILGTPLVAVIFVLVKLLYVHDALGQRVEVPGHEEPAPP